MEWTSRRELIDACAKEPERVADLVLDLRRQMSLARERIRELERRLDLNSQNSHKPPSSDGYKKPQPKSLREKSGRPSGGQPGHPGHRLELRENPEHIVRHRPSTCACCRHSLGGAPSEGYDRRQVFELVARVEATEHQAHTVRCPKCGEATTAAFPDNVAAQTQYGSAMKAFASYCDAYQFIPSERLRELIHDLTGHCLSEATLYHVTETLFTALQPHAAAVQAQLAVAPVTNHDESGLRVQGKVHWLHSASTPSLTAYHVDKRRGVVGMAAAGILPHRIGTVVHDGWPPYWTYAQCRHALCNVHHERELRAVDELDHQPWANRLIGVLHTAKAAVAAAREAGLDQLTAEQLVALTAKYSEVIEEGLAANPLPEPIMTPTGKPARMKKSKARNLLERLDLRREAVLLFMHDFAIPYSNNQGEQDIRMIKVQQKISGAFRTLDGAEQFCRLRGYISTLKKRALPVLHFLQEALEGRPYIPPAPG